MSLTEKILEALGFVYVNPDISQICTPRVRDIVSAVVTEYERELAELLKNLPPCWAGEEEWECQKALKKYLAKIQKKVADWRA